MRSLVPAVLVSSLALCGPAAGVLHAADDDAGGRKAEKQLKVEGERRETEFVKKPSAEGDETRGEQKARVKFEKQAQKEGGEKFAKGDPSEAQKKAAFRKDVDGGLAGKEFDKSGDNRGPEQTERAVAELRERREHDLAQLREAEQKVRQAYEIRENVLRGLAGSGGDKAKFRKDVDGDRRAEQKSSKGGEDRPADKGEKQAVKEGEPRSGRDIERAALEQDAKRLQQRMTEIQMQHEARVRELQRQMKAEQERMAATMGELQQARQNLEARARSLQGQ